MTVGATGSGVGIDGIRSGSGPSSGSEARFAAGFLGSGAAAKPADGDDADGLTARSVGAPDAGSAPGADEPRGMLPPPSPAPAVADTV
jgi:hypothetical protein